MRHRRLFAAGLAAALMLGAGAAPALAKPGKGKGHAYGHTKTKPDKPAKPAKPAPKPKKTKSGVSGGGAVATGEFSIQARMSRLGKGHFNYTDPTVKVRCRGFDADDVTISLGAPATATVDTDNCVTTRADGVRRPATVVATFTDAGQPSETAPPTPGPDSVDFTVTDAVGPVSVSGSVTGNVKIR